ncbi:MAG: hypothetical protein ABI591_01610 [Kofleriaceae bacterium]
MSESFVDLTYRGLVLGKRVKLTQVRPSTGYLELPAPMPVGTAIGIASEDGTTFDALVTEALEQVSGHEGVPGMTVRPRLDGAAAAWWRAKVALPDVVKPEAAPMIGIVRSKRSSNAGAVPELVDDGRNTAVQAAVDPAKLDVRADTDSEPEPEKDTQVIPMLDVPIVDDGRSTIAMDAVDLAALGLDASISGQIPLAKDDDDDDKPGDSKSGPAGKKKRRRR